MDDGGVLAELGREVPPQPGVVGGEVAVLRNPQLDGVALQPEEGQPRTAQRGEHQRGADHGHRPPADLLPQPAVVQ